MSTDQILSWVVSAVGILGFYLAGKKIWWTKNRNKKPEVEIPAVGFGDAIRIKQTNRIVFLDIYEERYQQGVFVTFQSHEGDQPTRPIVVSGSDDPTDK